MNTRKFMRMLTRSCALITGFRHKKLLRVRAERLARRNASLRAENLRLSHMVQFDSLTGIYNRVGITHEWEKFSSEIARSCLQAGALVFIDLNGFKPVNDHLGHNAGDHALVEVAKALASGVRPCDSVARIGGDEFIILLPGTAGRGVCVAVERLRALVREVCMDEQEFVSLASLRGRNYVLDFSAGVYVAEAGKKPPCMEQVIKIAENNMDKFVERRNLFTTEIATS